MPSLSIIPLSTRIVMFKIGLCSSKMHAVGGGRERGGKAYRNGRGRKELVLGKLERGEDGKVKRGKEGGRRERRRE